MIMEDMHLYATENLVWNAVDKDVILFRGRRVDNRELVCGDLIRKLGKCYILCDESSDLVQNKRNMMFYAGEFLNSKVSVKSVSNCQVVEVRSDSIKAFVRRYGL